MNAAAVPFRDGLLDGLACTSRRWFQVTSRLASWRLTLRIEISVLMPTTVSIGDLWRDFAVSALDRWLRDVERVDGYTPFTSPRCGVPRTGNDPSRRGRRRPRESVVWVGEPDGWTVLSDTNPRAWPVEMDVEITTTASLHASKLLEFALRDWNVATAARPRSCLVAREPRSARRQRCCLLNRRGGCCCRRPSRLSGLAAGPHSGQASRFLPWKPWRAWHVQSNAAGVWPRAWIGLKPLARPPGRQASAPEWLPWRNSSGRRKVTAAAFGPGKSTDAAAPVIGTALSGGRGYLINGASQRALLRRTGIWLAARAVALTEPLSERLAAALDKPARLFAAVLAASPIDAGVALLWGIGAIVLSIAMPMAVNLLFTSIWPRADVSGHWLVILGLLAITFTGVGFESARSLRARRLAMQFGSMLENGLWLRLGARLPLRSVSGGGDTLERILTASQLNRLLGSQPMKFVTDLGLLAIAIGQMVYYGGQLAWIGAVAALLIMRAVLYRTRCRRRPKPGPKPKS